MSTCMYFKKDMKNLYLWMIQTCSNQSHAVMNHNSVSLVVYPYHCNIKTCEIMCQTQSKKIVEKKKRKSKFGRSLKTKTFVEPKWRNLTWTNEVVDESGAAFIEKKDMQVKFGSRNFLTNDKWLRNFLAF